MLGHRGCRLGIVYPEITAMQARAILEAACKLKKDGIDCHPEIMIPLAGYKTEFDNQEAVVRETAAKVFEEQGTDVDYMVGTMIEVPRAALTADEIAQKAEFFSFGTNDLTQTTLGISRDDYKGFITDYLEKDIMPSRSIPDGRHGRCRQAHEDGCRRRTQHPQRSQDRHLRRTRRRPEVGLLLPPDRPQLRQLLPPPYPHRPPGGSSGGTGELIEL